MPLLNVEGFVKLLIDVFKLVIAVLLVFMYPNSVVDVAFILVILCGMSID